MKKADGKQAFAIGILGLLPLICLCMCYWGSDLPTSVRIFFLIVAIICALLMLFALYGEIPNFLLVSKIGRLVVTPRELAPPKRKRMDIMPSIVPQHDDRGASDVEVQSVHEQFYQILEKGKVGTEKYVEAVEFFSGNLSQLKKSWRLTANFARCLVFTGEFESAQEIAETVIAQFSDNPEAVASAYEIMALASESRIPVVNGKLREEVLEQIMRYVEKGLAVSPNRSGLLLNGFETAVRQGRAEAALMYLCRATIVNKQGTYDHLLRWPELASAAELSPELRKSLEGLGLNTGHVSPKRNGRPKNVR